MKMRVADEAKQEASSKKTTIDASLFELLHLSSKGTTTASEDIRKQQLHTAAFGRRVERGEKILNND